MTLGKMLRCLTAGFLFGVLAIGILPFLLIFNWAEMLGLSEYGASPLFMLAGQFLKRNAAPSDEEEERKAGERGTVERQGRNT
ncbi:hypothetical protein KP806_16945 [Paenibacillus sp. N4]|uniref:hypothetical protein n=1 Tax=Paenibacillus vietnamensis TaxID=2590547 RepID=UPI001CD104A8|nr:hypothetical protein [Paenibacillus vietnamensis]MCA0756746.1 hypothetical protein [Paenibacillus vietnamensis]